MKVLDKISDIVYKFRGGNKDMITFDQLKLLPLLETIQIVPEVEGAIQTTKISEKESSLSFRVEMKKGYKWAPHIHDCWEIIVVYTGECKDLISNKIASKHQQLIIKPNTLHEVECLSDESIFYVEFIKQQ